MPSEKATLAYRLEGVVDSVLVEEGDEVEKDQLLIQMDDRALAVNEARAKLAAEDDTQIRSAELQHRLYEAEKQRAEALKDTLAESEVLKARIEADLAAVQLAAARKNHEDAKLQYELQKVTRSYTRVTSPFKGVISRVLIRPGEASRDMQPLLEVVRVDEVKVLVHLSEDCCGKLKEGHKVEVRFPVLGDKWFEGRIARIFPVVEPRSGTFMVKITVPNEVDKETGKRPIKPGLSAQVRFPPCKETKPLVSEGEADRGKLVLSKDTKR